MRRSVALFLLPPLAAALPARGGDGEGEAAAIEAAFATITEEDLARHLVHLASPELEGRDSPSAGLRRAAEYIESEWREAGLTGAGPGGSFRTTYRRRFSVPLPLSCSLVVERAGEEARSYVFGDDFVPLPHCEGEGVAEGEPVFLGFGISASRERYDDFRAGSFKGKVAVVLEGEPRHKKLFDGPDVITDASDAYAKLGELEQKGAVGVLFVRRGPARPSVDAEDRALVPTPLGYRYTWASWNREGSPGARRAAEIPVLEIEMELAGALLGVDLTEVAARIDETGKPERIEPEGVTVRLAATFRDEDVDIENVVGVLAGCDPALAAEHLVLGAHYDHIGVDPWGRVGLGADDNASGTASLIELAQALAVARPRRSVLFCAFSSEEDGLIGSAAIAERPPVPVESLVAMLNMDMVGYGRADTLAVLGTRQNPALDKVLKRAKRLEKTGVTKVITGKAEHLWQRSDHYSFHAVGVPALFFFESDSELDNAFYHTYHDTIDKLSFDKIANTTRFVFNTAWLIANDERRPPAPKD